MVYQVKVEKMTYYNRILVLIKNEIFELKNVTISLSISFIMPKYSYDMNTQIPFCLFSNFLQLFKVENFAT